MAPHEIDIVYWGIFALAAINGGILVAALLSRKVNQIPNRLLSVVILSMLYSHLVSCLRFTGVGLFWGTQQKWGLPLWTSCSVAIYFYVDAMVTPGFRFERKHFVHLILPLIGVIWASVIGYLGVESHLFQTTQSHRWELGIILSTFGLYFIGAQVRLSSFVSESRNYFSSLSAVRLTWLRIFLILLFSLWAMGVVWFIEGPFGMSWKFLPLVSTMIILVMGFLALRQSTIFFPADEPLKKDVKTVLMPKSETEKIIKRLMEYMDTSKVFLDPDLRLRTLSDELQIRPQVISEVLNKGLGTNFYDFVNGYRLAEAKKRLIEPQYTHLNILGIANDCGFNSKSVFNEIFKRKVGVTPSEFRVRSSPQTSV